MIEPAFGRFKWEDSLEEEYREAEVVDEIVGDHVFLSVRNAGVLTGAELAELAPHYIADHAANSLPRQTTVTNPKAVTLLRIRDLGG